MDDALLRTYRLFRASKELVSHGPVVVEVAIQWLIYAVYLQDSSKHHTIVPNGWNLGQ